MDSILKSDIFFFITSALAVLITIFVIWALVYIISIVKTAKSITRRAQQLVNATSEDVDAFRDNLKKGDVNWMNVLGSFIPKKKSASRKNAKQDKKA